MTRASWAASSSARDDLKELPSARKGPAGFPAGRRDAASLASRDARAEAGAELAEVDGVHAAAAVVIERRVVGAERLAEQSEIDRVHRAGAVRIAEKPEEA